MIELGKCYKCGKHTYFTKRRKVLCHECQAKSIYINPEETGTFPKSPRHGIGAYRVREQRRRIIKKQGRCQLCGATENLTAHHIGGSTELGLTCLCRECHTAYERWNKERKEKRERLRLSN